MVWLSWYDLAAGYKSFIRKLLIIHVFVVRQVGRMRTQPGECLNKVRIKIGEGARKHKINDCPKHSQTSACILTFV